MTKRYRLVGSEGQEILSRRPGTLGGHRRTRVYGRLDCPVALSLIARGFDVRRHRVFFADEETAIAARLPPVRRVPARGAPSPEGRARIDEQQKMHRAGGAFVRLSD